MVIYRKIRITKKLYLKPSLEHHYQICTKMDIDLDGHANKLNSLAFQKNSQLLSIHCMWSICDDRNALLSLRNRFVTLGAATASYEYPSTYRFGNEHGSESGRLKVMRSLV